MIIETYRTLTEKAEYFDCENIETREDFDRLSNYWTDASKEPSKDNENRFIFRGLTEAKYKLYNSAQRFWIGEELTHLGRTFEEFIQTEIDRAKAFQSNLLIKFYHAFGHPAYDLSILSFLQHYGAPTPLIDFTYKFDSAAFFGIDGLKHYPSTDIDNYFSIYAIDTRKSPREFPSIIDHITSSLGQLDELLETYKEKEVDATETLQNFEQLRYRSFHGLALFYIPGFTPNGIKFTLRNRPNFNLVFNQHNLNIINQAGLFVFNSDPTRPLEYHFSGKLEVGKTFNLPKIKCWNIHKSLNEYVVRYLTEGIAIRRNHPIDRAFMFPQEELIATSAFRQFKNFI
jgi:hypothetical protein